MGWQAVPEAANGSSQMMSIPTLSISEEGYVFVYLSYEAQSNQWVYFNNLKVTHTKTNVIQYNEYYPFGLQTSASWTRENNKNDFLYNAGSELNSTTDWLETPFRDYDPVLGRFMQVDPMAAYIPHQSPFNYADNIPNMRNDPLGLMTWNEILAMVDHALRPGSVGGQILHADGSGLYIPFMSQLDAFYTGVGLMDTHGWWGGGGGQFAGSFGDAAREYAKITGDAVPLRGVTINGFRNPYGPGRVFTGEPYYDTYWLHKRLNEAFPDYDAWFKRQTDELQASLDAMGTLDPSGFIDFVNAAISVARGDKEGAAIRAMSMVPYVGDAAKTTKVVNAAAKTGMTDLQLVTRAAQKAEAAIGGSGGVAGTLKHTYAKNLLSRYQSIYGDRGLSLGSNYFNGPAGRGFLDVVNHNTKMIYDFKFGNAFMSNAQYLKYSNSFPGYGIQVIRP